MDYEDEEEDTVEMKGQQEGENIRVTGQEAAHAHGAGEQGHEQGVAGGTGPSGEEKRESEVHDGGAGVEGEGGEGDGGQVGEGEGGEKEKETEPAEILDPDPVIILTPPKSAVPSFIPNRRYYAVKEVRASGTPCRPLNKRSNAEDKNDGGFEQEGDERWGRNWNKFDVEKGRNVSSSFNPVTGVCGT